MLGLPLVLIFNCLAIILSIVISLDPDTSRSSLSLVIGEVITLIDPEVDMLLISLRVASYVIGVWVKKPVPFVALSSSVLFFIYCCKRGKILSSAVTISCSMQLSGSSHCLMVRLPDV